MKPRRDITLGEMQDECKKHWNNGNFGYCGRCQYMSACCHYERYCPAQLNLTDPPRFTEQQMALLRGLHQNGASKIIATMANTDVYGRNGNKMAEIDNSVFCIAWGETLDLAELLGKDAT